MQTKRRVNVKIHQKNSVFTFGGDIPSLLLLLIHRVMSYNNTLRLGTNHATVKYIKVKYYYLISILNAKQKKV